jgi:hypothetical protein
MIGIEGIGTTRRLLTYILINGASLPDIGNFYMLCGRYTPLLRLKGRETCCPAVASIRTTPIYRCRVYYTQEGLALHGDDRFPFSGMGNILQACSFSRQGDLTWIFQDASRDLHRP